VSASRHPPRDFGSVDLGATHERWVSRADVEDPQ